MIKTAIKQIRWELRHQVAKHPMVYMPLAKQRHRNDNPTPVNDQMELVIEGFPRCANSFATIAFQLAQDRHVEIAHHLHAPAQIKEAARHNTPSIVVIREPEAAILSIRAYANWITNRQLLRAYIDFYRTVVAYQNWVVIAPFNKVISDYGVVIDELNRRFGTTFYRFEHTEENINRCFKKITKGSEIFVSRPSTQRNKRKEKMRSDYYAKHLRMLRSEAEGIYNSLCSSSISV